MKITAEKLNSLFEIQEDLLREFGSTELIPREVYGSLTYDNNATGIVGLRGVGKTTMLLQEALKFGALERKALYLSADDFALQGVSLLEVADFLYRQLGVHKLYLDEIHKYANWNQELKNISDRYPQLRVVFTSSSAIDIVHSRYDLSRRVTLINLPGLSFREYIQFKSGLELARVELPELLEDPQAINSELLAAVPQPLVELNHYLEQGYYPLFLRFSQREELFGAIDNAVKKTIYEDIGTIKQFKSTNLVAIERLLNFVVNTSSGEISVQKLSNALGKDFDTTSNYLAALIAAGLVIGVYNQTTGGSFLRNPEKVFPANTNMMTARRIPLLAGDKVGKFREVFALAHLNQALGVDSVRSTKAGDFLIADQYHFEIGGRTKSGSQVADVDSGYVFAADSTSVDISGRKIPLYLLGLLY